jgi:hypothetical protein
VIFHFKRKKIFKILNIVNYLILKNYINSFLIGDWGLGIGDWAWGLGIGPNPQSPIPNPQSPILNRFSFIKNNE